MFAPNGPLPPRIYWRRRAVAAGASVLAVVVLAWVIGGLVGAADDQPVRGVAGDRPVSSSPPAPSRSVAPGSSATATTSAVPSVPAGAPKVCPDSVVRVTARTGAARYRVGERPVLRLVVVNAGAVPCVRDVDRRLRELVIVSGDGRRRLWSSNDCYPARGAERRVLVPGRPVEFELRWAGRTSEPGCPVERRTVPAGTYSVIGKLGRLAGAPVPLVLTR